MAVHSHGQFSVTNTLVLKAITICSDLILNILKSEHLGTKKNQAAFFVAGCNLYDTDA
jgi:hypothetical protein